MAPTPQPPLHSQSLQEIVDSLAERLQRSVALDDPTISLIVASRHFGDEDSVRVQSVLGRGVDAAIRDAVFALGVECFDGPGRTGPLPQFGAKARICVPVRCAGMLLGYLWLIDDAQITDNDLRDAAVAADAAGLILYRDELFRQRRLAHGSALVHDLISADEATRLAAEAEALEEGLFPEDVNVVAIVATLAEPAPAGQEEVLGAVARCLVGTDTGAALLCLARPHDLVVLGAQHPSPVDAAAETRIARRLVAEASDRSGHRALAGSGAPQSRLRGARRSYQQALVALRAAQRLPGLGEVAAWGSLGVYAPLAMLDPEDLRLAAQPAPLARLAASRNHDVLVSTAEAFLDLAGSVHRTAEALHIHRATLYQRLTRIQAVSGVDLDDGGDRLTLHLAIKLARLTGGLPASPSQPR